MKPSSHVVLYYDDMPEKVKFTERWGYYKDGVHIFHNDIGPAWIKYERNGTIRRLAWFWDGQMMKFDEWFKIAKKCNPSSGELVELRLKYGK